MAWYLRNAGRGYAYDESITVGLFVNADLWAPFTRQQVANNHPFFSFVEQLVWRLGGTSEAWMRLLPALFAGATIGLIIWWSARRWNARTGIVAGVIVASTPMFAYFGQHARGYSLMVLCAVASTMLVQQLIHEERTGLLRAAYVVVAAMGLATHLYMAFALAGHVGLVATNRQLGVRWVVLWLRASAVGGLAYVGGSMPHGRAGLFRPAFPTDVLFGLLGATAISSVVLGAVVAAAMWRSRRSSLVVVPPMALFLMLWLVARPLDLYPRFFVVVVPAVALAAASMVARRPILAVPVLVAAAAMAPFAPPSDFGLRATAEVLERSIDRGAQPCAVGSEALVAYLTVVPEFSPNLRCDVIAKVGSWDPPGLDAERARLSVATVGDITVLGALQSEVEAVGGTWGSE